MKLVFLLAMLAMPSLALAQANCEKVSQTVSKCSVSYACYITEVSECSKTIQTLTGFYKYFTYKSVCLNTSWLEDSQGVLAGSLKKFIAHDGGRDTKRDDHCEAWKDEKKSKITPPAEVKRAIDQFLAN